MTKKINLSTLPSLPALGAIALIIVGILLAMFASKGFLFISGIGAFGLGALRELNWLSDQDEYQREAARRAGYHAYLAGGMVTLLVISALEWPGSTLSLSIDWIMVIMISMWMTWMFSSLLSFWGAQKTTFRVLMTFGAFWAVFVIASGIGEATEEFDLSTTLMGIAASIGILAPFFLGAWSVKRWPETTGTALLAVSTVFLFFFFRGGGLQIETQILTGTLLVIPLLGCGIALLKESRTPSEEEDE